MVFEAHVGRCGVLGSNSSFMSSAFRRRLTLTEIENPEDLLEDDPSYDNVPRIHAIAFNYVQLNRLDAAPVMQ